MWRYVCWDAITYT